MMDDQTKTEVAVGRWELWKQHHCLLPEAEVFARDVATKVMMKQFRLEGEVGAFQLTGEQMLFRTDLMVALLESEALLRIFKDQRRFSL